MHIHLYICIYACVSAALAASIGIALEWVDENHFETTQWDTYEHTCIHTSIYLGHTDRQTCVHTYMRVHTHTCMHACICVYKHIYMYTHIYIYMHYVEWYIHVYTCIKYSGACINECFKHWRNRHKRCALLKNTQYKYTVVRTYLLLPSSTISPSRYSRYLHQHPIYMQLTLTLGKKYHIKLHKSMIWMTMTYRANVEINPLWANDLVLYKKKERTNIPLESEEAYKSWRHAIWYLLPVCCSLLQCKRPRTPLHVMFACSVLQCVAVCETSHAIPYDTHYEYVAVCGSGMHCAAVLCSVREISHATTHVIQPSLAGISKEGSQDLLTNSDTTFHIPK